VAGKSGRGGPDVISHLQYPWPEDVSGRLLLLDFPLEGSLLPSTVFRQLVFKVVAQSSLSRNAPAALLRHPRSELNVERHLIIEELCLRPSGEWKPEARGWSVVRVAEGAGYSLQGAGARELNVGDTVITGPSADVIFRASQLGVLKLEFFLVLPQYLNGLLTVAEWRQLENASGKSTPKLLCFPASDPTAQKFTRLAAQKKRDCLSSRSAMLQLWASAIADLLPKQDSSDGSGIQLRDRFREFIGKMSESELATRSLPELAEQLHCSERHFSRLFREEFNISLRSRQTELRLQRARQLLAATNNKIINVAYESGYRHLGLFNAMFKRRFGVTPSAWRQKNLTPPTESFPGRSGGGVAMAVLLLFAQIFFSPDVKAQATNTPATNAPAHFKVEKYVVSGNTILPPEKMGSLFTNVPESFGTNVTFADIRSALAQLQTAYRERGFVTVSVGLPPQKLTNAAVKIKVTEGRLAAIKVQGNHWYSTPNVLRALPSLHTNMLLNSHVFQRELDLANANRDRQIYPVIGPGYEPGTSELTLKVKDRFPVHARVEWNNQATPGTPDSRIAFSAQYGNLWNLEHQMGVSYNFSPLNYHPQNIYYYWPLDLPLIANYSVYYRLPLGRMQSVQDQVDSSQGRFGYNEITHQFVMPPPSGRPELTAYASRATTDSEIQFGPREIITASSLLQLGHQTAGQNLTLNQGIGMKYSMPLPKFSTVSSTLSVGIDYKYYRAASANADLFYELITTTNGTSPLKFGNVLYTAQSFRQTAIDYFPLNIGLNGSIPDSYGMTVFNVQANFNLAVLDSSTQSGTNFGRGGFAGLAYSTNAQNNYVTMQAGMSREQRLYKDWTMLIRADGQWASTPLFSNEQYGMGGVSGVRGYSDGAAYGDTGWRVALEPRTPLINLGMVDGNVPFWMRASVFMDYGEIYQIQKFSGQANNVRFLGTGCSLTVNIGNHLDARLTLAWPLIGHEGQHDSMHIYFGAGAQF